MRLLHTADWHAGRSLAQANLDPGLWSALDQMLEFALREKVDAVLVTGDLFDSHRPGADSQERVYEFFLRLYQEKIPALILSGNHDSLRHWGALKKLFSLAGVSIVPQLSLDAVLTLNTRSGPLEVAALPWPTERVLAPLAGTSGSLEQRRQQPGAVDPEQRHQQPGAVDPEQRRQQPGAVDPEQRRQHSGVLDSEQRRQQWSLRVQQFLAALMKAMGNQGHRVLAGHLHVDSAALSDTERLTGSYTIPKDILPAELDYVALGHLHRPQEVSMAPAPSWYCGAPRCMSFAEGAQPRGFLRVDLRPRVRAEVELIPVPPSLPLKEVRFPLERLEQVAQEVQGFSGYLKALVEVQRPEVGLRDRVRDALGERVLMVQEERTGSPAGPRPQPVYDLSDPRKTFREFYAQRHSQQPPPDSLMAAFNELLEELEDPSGEPPPPAPKPQRGRPPGSKNKPKTEAL